MPGFCANNSRIASRRKRVNSTPRGACLGKLPCSLTRRDKNGSAFVPPRAVTAKMSLLSKIDRQWAPPIQSMTTAGHLLCQTASFKGPITSVIGANRYRSRPRGAPLFIFRSARDVRFSVENVRLPPKADICGYCWMSALCQKPTLVPFTRSPRSRRRAALPPSGALSEKYQRRNSGEIRRGRNSGICGQVMIATSTSSIGTSMIIVSLSA